MSRRSIHIQSKRTYDPPAKRDGHRVLVDGIWPHGIKKEELERRMALRDFLLQSFT
jgi:uncharacterized protein YeaO (DUF488 family)